MFTLKVPKPPLSVPPMWAYITVIKELYISVEMRSPVYGFHAGHLHQSERNCVVDITNVNRPVFIPELI